MTTSPVFTLEQTIHETNAWIGELREELGTDSQAAYNALRAVLHALRDRLTVEEASDLGAQLPVLVRGIYYENFNPSQQPSGKADKQAFLDRVSHELERGPGRRSRICRDGSFSTADGALHQRPNRSCTRSAAQGGAGAVARLIPDAAPWTQCQCHSL